jgi:aminoglycoside 3-N-acetyltransferase
MRGVRRLKKIIKRHSVWINKNWGNRGLSEESLLNDLASTGLKKGDHVMIHSSLSSIGVVNQGANTVIRALKKYITKDGQIVMPAFIGSNMLNYIENYQIWDAKSSPSYNGKITECFRKSEEVIRSLHPTHSLSAWGNRAHEFVSGHENGITPFDEKTPYRKLITNNYKILFIGLDLFSMTLCRAGDDYVDNYPVNPYLDKIYEVPIKDFNGRKLIVKTKCHNPIMSERRRNMFLFPLLKDKMHIGRLGRAHTILLEAKDVINAQEELTRSGKTVYGTPEDFLNFDDMIESYNNFIKKSLKTV